MHNKLILSTINDTMPKNNPTPINQNLYSKLVEAAALMLLKETQPNTNINPAIDCFIEITEKENLNEVTDIYIAIVATNTLEKKLKDTLLHAITAIIAYQYKSNNLEYLEQIILNKQENNRSIALDYYLKMGRYHDKFSNTVLSFVQKNSVTLSREQLRTTAWYLYNIYPKSNRTINILQSISKLNP